MCYSAQINQDYRDYVRHNGADIDLKEFVRIYWQRGGHPEIRIPKGMDVGFANPASEDERAIKSLIEEYNASQATVLQQEIFKQRKRLADAERKLLDRVTKAAIESRRIATGKVEWAMARLADLRRTTPMDSDSRIFPGY